MSRNSKCQAVGSAHTGQAGEARAVTVEKQSSHRTAWPQAVSRTEAGAEMQTEHEFVASDGCAIANAAGALSL